MVKKVGEKFKNTKSKRKRPLGTEYYFDQHLQSIAPERPATIRYFVNNIHT